MFTRILSCIMAAIVATTPMSELPVRTATEMIDIPPVVEIVEIEEVEEPETIIVEEETVTPEPEPVEPPVVEPEPEAVTMSEEDIELIALVTMAEAEGECELGKRLVIDTILNRMDNERWPDTASGVIYQKNQFTSMWNGRVDRCYVRDDIVQLVREELISRTNSECVFFRLSRYSDYGSPMFQVGAHYFSAI